MTTCPSCGRENSDDRDFCVCGEYLRWEPTQHIKALEPAAAGRVAAPAGRPTSDTEPTEPMAPADPNMTLPPSAAVRPGGSHGAGVDRVAGEPPPNAATLLLRRPEDEETAAGPIDVAVKPGERTTVIALIRNESGVVDNYDLKVTGLPDGWWSATPPTAYLVPFGTGGKYEQEIQIHVHPPRSPDAQARPWAVEVVAFSRAFQRQVASSLATVRIGTYHDVAAKVAPDRASGRLKARLVLTVRNRANAPVEVLVGGEDTDGECEFRFAAPSVTIEPGRGIEAPFTVIPPKQIWIGRSKDRQLGIMAAPAGADPPPPPLRAVYRQRSWLPWWLAVVAPLVAIAVAAVILLLPKQTAVPNVVGAKSQAAAAQVLTKAGLKLVTPVPTLVSSAAPGSVIKQVPAAGKKVKRGTPVLITLAVAPAKIAVPNVVGLPTATAAAELKAAGLQLGTISPPGDNANIASQIPGAGMMAAKGSPVAVFLPPPPPGSKSATTGTGTAGSAKSPAAAKKPVPIPIIAGNPMLAAQTLSKAGFVPTSGEQYSTSKAGTLVGTNPPAGTPVAPGGKVQLLVSGGWPDVSYDNGTNIFIAGVPGKPAKKLPASGQPQDEASWSPDGASLVYVQGPASAGQLFSVFPGQSGKPPVALTAPGSDDRDPAFAPTTAKKLLAYVDDSGGGSKLCFGIVGPNQINPACTSHPGWTLGRQVAWSPDGTKILAFGTKNGSNGTVFGLIEFVSNVAFSTQASLWGQGTVVTDISQPGHGVIAGAFSPNGKQVALAANIGTSGFYVFIAPAGDFKLAPPAKALAVSACQVAWRPDSQELAVMQADTACAAPLGNIVGVNPSSPTTLTPIATQAANPAWQPLSLGG